MIGTITVTVGATHPRGHVDVLVVHPFIAAGGLQVLSGVAEVTAVGWRLADDVEEHFVLGVEPTLVVMGEDFLPVEFRVVKVIQLGRAALHGGQAAGHGRRPSVVLLGGLQGGIALVMLAVSVVAGEAVDFVFAGNLGTLEHRRLPVKLLIGWFHLAVVATGIVAAEFLEEFPGGQVNVAWLVGAFPAPVGDGNLHADAVVGQHPRLPHPAAQDVGAAGVEMPTGGNGVVVVALAAGDAHRDGARLAVGRLDLDVVFIEQIDEVRDRGAVAVVAVPESLALLRRLAKRDRPEQKQRLQQCPDDLTHQIGTRAESPVRP